MFKIVPRKNRKRGGGIPKKKKPRGARKRLNALDREFWAVGKRGACVTPPKWREKLKHERG